VASALAALALGACDRGGAPAAPSPSAARTVDETLARAGELAGQELYHQAITLLRERAATASGDDLYRLQLTLGRRLLEIQAVMAAEPAIDAALAVRPGDAAALIARGEHRRLMARFDEAEEDLRRGLAALPGSIEGNVSLARTLYRLGNAAESLKLFEECFAASGGAAPAGVEAWELRLEYARALLLGGRAVEATDELALLLETRPFESQLYSELSKGLYRRGRREAAKFIQDLFGAMSRDDYQKQVEATLLNTGMVSFPFWLGQRAFNHRREKRFLEALRAYERACAYENADARLALYSSQLLAALLRQRQALETLDRALGAGLEPRSGLLAQRGAALAALDQRQEAEAAFAAAEAALAAEGARGGPEKGQAARGPLMLERIGNLAAIGRLEEALRRSEEARRSGLAGWEAAYWAGRMALDLGRLDAAAEALADAAARGGEGDLGLGVARARLLSARGDLAGAYRDLFELVKRNAAFLPAYEAVAELGRKGHPLPAEFARGWEQLRAMDARRRDLVSQLQGRPLDAGAGLLYIEIAKTLIQLREAPAAKDLLFLALELVPNDAASVDGLRLMLAQLAASEDVFLRLRYLRRLLALLPEDPHANLALANIDSKLGVRLDEARTAAERYARAAPGEQADRLLEALRAAK
jgi:predicted Zn-dependent protease